MFVLRRGDAKRRRETLNKAAMMGIAWRRHPRQKQTCLPLFAKDPSGGREEEGRERQMDSPQSCLLRVKKKKYAGVKGSVSAGVRCFGMCVCVYLTQTDGAGRVPVCPRGPFCLLKPTLHHHRKTENNNNRSKQRASLLPSPQRTPILFSLRRLQMRV